jgi:hypothetical protein
MSQQMVLYDDEDSINVPLLFGLLSGLGVLLLALLIAVLWSITSSGGIRLTGDEPGAFDDEGAYLEQEQEALEHMDERSRQSYFEARAFIENNPPNSYNSDISLSQYMTIQEKGVSAWEFDVDVDNVNCLVEDRTEIEFFDGVGCVQTNLPLPKQNEVYYWEAKIYDKPETTTLSLGLATKPYPTFRLPGYHRYSIAYDSMGSKRISQPFTGTNFGPSLQQGDVVGVGYRSRSGTVFFTRNGHKLDDGLHGMKLNLFPTIGANGPCTVVVNFGRAAFVYIEANVKKWGLAPAHGSLAPPPPYGVERDSVLLEAAVHHHLAQQSSTSPPPFEHVTRSQSSVSDIDDSPNRDGINLTRLSGLRDREQTAESGVQADHESQLSRQSRSSASHSSQTETNDDAAGLAGTSTSARITNVSKTVHSPPPSYTSDTESVSELED